MAAQLIITEPSGRKRTFSLAKGNKLAIGRGTGNDIILLDQEASRSHCTITWNDGGIRIEDHDSRNGTCVNSKPIKAGRHLKDGDTATVGRCTIRLVTLWSEKGGAARGIAIPRKLRFACIAAVVFAVGTAAGLFSDQLAELVGTGSTAEPGAPADEWVKVLSSPPGATVFVDNEYAGVTPVVLRGQKGKHSVRLVLWGYEPYSEVVDVNGRRAEVSVDLVPIEPAFIQITSDPSDAAVFMDGYKVGRSPITVKTVPGSHNILIHIVYLSLLFHLS